MGERSAEKHKYYLKNKKRIRKSNEEWRQKNFAHVREYARKYDSHQKKTARAKYSGLLSTAKKRLIEVTLTFDEYVVLTSQPCFYCNSPLPSVGSGLDRIDNRIGYVNGNARPCCTTCNLAKRELSENEFKEWILKVFNNWIHGATKI